MRPGLETRVEGSAAECRRTARRLRHLAQALQGAARATTRDSHLSEDDFGGLSGEAFRRHASSLSVAAGDEADRCHTLAAAAGDLARGLDEAEALMDRARDAADPVLRVEGWTIRPPLGPDERQRLAWARASTHVHEARVREREAQFAWLDTLARLTGTPPPVTYVDPPPGGGPGVGAGDIEAPPHLGQTHLTGSLAGGSPHGAGAAGGGLGSCWTHPLGSSWTHPLGSSWTHPLGSSWSDPELAAAWTGAELGAGWQTTDPALPHHVQVQPVLLDDPPLPVCPGPGDIGPGVPTPPDPLS